MVQRISQRLLLSDSSGIREHKILFPLGNQPASVLLDVLVEVADAVNRDFVNAVHLVHQMSKRIADAGSMGIVLELNNLLAIHVNCRLCRAKVLICCDQVGHIGQIHAKDVVEVHTDMAVLGKHVHIIVLIVLVRFNGIVVNQCLELLAGFQLLNKCHSYSTSIPFILLIYRREPVHQSISEKYSKIKLEYLIADR